MLFYDDQCQLCTGVIDKLRGQIPDQLQGQRSSQSLLFAPLHGPEAQRLRVEQPQFFNKQELPDAALLLVGDHLWSKSEALIRAGWLAGGVWRLAALGWFIPGFLRDWLYDHMARRRHLWPWSRKPIL